MVSQYSIKYRPRRWEDVFGHDNIVKSLRKRIKEDNFPKACLFYGLTGCGKSTLAFLSAASLQAPLEDGNPDWNHPSNKAILSERFDRDTMMLDGSQMSGKDDMIEFMSSLKTRPMRDRVKIYIIEEADQLSNAAQLALLKILENPIPNVYFMLLSMDNKVPAAIKNRCQVYNLKPLSIPDTMKAMKYVMEQEGDWNNPNIPDSFKLEGLGIIAAAAKGSLRSALQFLENCINSETWEKDKIEALLNSVDELTASKILLSLLDKSKDHTLWQNIFNYDPQELYNYLTLVISQAMIYKTTGYCNDERFEASTSKIANHPNAQSLFDILINQPQMNKPYMRKADLLAALAEYMNRTTSSTNKLVIGDPNFEKNKLHRMFEQKEIPVRTIPTRARTTQIPF